jgi:hypothetical protein
MTPRGEKAAGATPALLRKDFDGRLPRNDSPGTGQSQAPLGA